MTELRLFCRHLLLASPIVVVQVSVALRELRGAVDDVAREEEVVLGGNGKGVSRKNTRVDGKGTSHLARDPKVRVLILASA